MPFGIYPQFGTSKVFFYANNEPGGVTNAFSASTQFGTPGNSLPRV